MASELRKRLAFERRADASDGGGNTKADFEEVFVTRGRVRPRLGGESVIAARLSGVRVASIKVRSTPETREVDESWRIRELQVDANGNYIFYDIKSLANADERNRYIEFLCEKGGSNG